MRDEAVKKAAEHKKRRMRDRYWPGMKSREYKKKQQPDIAIRHCTPAEPDTPQAARTGDLSASRSDLSASTDRQPARAEYRAETD